MARPKKNKSTDTEVRIAPRDFGSIKVEPIRMNESIPSLESDDAVRAVFDDEVSGQLEDHRLFGTPVVLGPEHGLICERNSPLGAEGTNIVGSPQPEYTHTAFDLWIDLENGHTPTFAVIKFNPVTRQATVDALGTFKNKNAAKIFGEKKDTLKKILKITY